MNPKLQRVQQVLRQSGLLTITEKLRYWLSVVRYNQSNKTFISKHPDFKVPPQALAYDAYSAPDWEYYMASGLSTAKALFDIAEKNLDVMPAKVLEWGCGPARVVRHMPAVFGPGTEVYGSDYNSDSIGWCASNVPDVKFVKNELNPPFSFDSECFDLVYSISVFTHLSEAVSYEWIDELIRVVRLGGILIISTNGDSRLGVMLPEEVDAYNATGIVIRDKFEEGKKMFWACHSPDYLRMKLFKDLEVLDHKPAGFPHTGQDMWVLRKPKLV
ncbi:class I SAM-dependent methyltransferase [Mariprofundus sp. KV]|uniref:class I SAM-dependent methyltransferase n=1 Tax=Mariprofundus sp. KV TaxID=2608715 RepID=UPI0015A25039|nr:class I SAM-dependent methyltransferase [Mariprofundus sp. KV]